MISAPHMSALDASLLAVETPTAHMHMGWAATFSAPAGGVLPDFSELRDHIEQRLGRAPRYRQKLAPFPLGLRAPEWVDDPAFGIARHVYPASGPLQDLVDEVMSMPLRRDRPLWEIWICEDVELQQIGLVGKVHHCLVKGIAAVELSSLLLDPTPEPRSSPAQEEWRAAPQPGVRGLLARGAREILGEQTGLLTGSLRALSSPPRAARQTAGGALRVTRALGHSLQAAPASMLNRPLSPLRRLAWTERPLADLSEVRRVFDTTIDSVLLAAVAGALRAYLLRSGQEPVVLKAMVPVNVHGPGSARGGHTSFLLAELPCDEPHPLGRLHRVHETIARRERDGEPEAAELALKAAAHTPPAVQHALSRIVANPRTFNLVVSNIPGPAEALYLRGCPLQATYPVVPLADRHALSVGMTTVRDLACFGVYADRSTFPDADGLARDIDGAIAELLAEVY
jgi:diacylglycerol O-acyltransferase